MSIEVHIGDEISGDQAHIYDWFREQPTATEVGLGLSVISPKEVHGQFRAATRSSAGTTEVIACPEDGSIILTDLVLGTTRTNNATVTVRFSDGTNTVNIFSGNTNDAPINIALSLGGRVRGWQNADLQLVTTGSVVANLTCVYYKSTNGLGFNNWDKKR